MLYRALISTNETAIDESVLTGAHVQCKLRYFRSQSRGQERADTTEVTILCNSDSSAGSIRHSNDDENITEGAGFGSA